MVCTGLGVGAQDVFRPKYSEDRRSRPTGAEGEVPQAPSNRSEASHEGEKCAARPHPKTVPKPPKIKAFRALSVAAFWYNDPVIV